MIELILLDASAVPTPPEAHRVLAPAELKSFDIMLAASRRREYLLGRALLKAALTGGGFRRERDYGMIETSLSPSGKPSVAGAEFSLSHDGEALLLGVGDQSIGVDLETVQRFDDEMLTACFCPEERRRIRDARDPARAATLAWCMKEAVAKAAGSSVVAGLGRPLDDASFLRGGFVRVAGIERAFAVASLRALPPVELSPALPRFSSAFL